MEKETILAIALKFEQDRGLELEESDKKLVSSSGVGDKSSKVLEDELKRFITENINNKEIVGSAIFALGKSYNKNNKDYLISVLGNLVEIDMVGAFQAMIALDNIGESVLGSSNSILEQRVNYERAKKYLNSQYS